jgi:uncharacterized membrane protein YhhN
MAAFGVAHVCYIVMFTRKATHRSLVVVAAYGVLWAGTLVLLWPGLGDNRIPVAAYSLLVAATYCVAQYLLSSSLLAPVREPVYSFGDSR